MDLRDAGWHDIGDVRFQLTIPGGSLDFNEFFTGFRYVQRGRTPRSASMLKTLVIWLVLSLLTFTLFGSLVSLQASLSIWVNESGKLLLYLSNLKVLYFVVISIFLGVALAISGIKISTNKLYHRLFQQNESCQNGYALFFTDIGMGWINRTSCGFVAWSEVNSVVLLGHHDYILMKGSHYAWIPHEIRDELRKPAIHFIQKQIAIHNIAQ